MKAPVVLACATALILSATYADATIGPKSTYQSFFQQTSTTLTSDGFQVSTCANVTNCTIPFSKVPNGKTLIITQVSCSLNMTWVTDVGSVVYVKLEPLHPPGEILRNQHFVAVPQDGTNSNYAVNGTTMQIFTPGDTPAIRVQTLLQANFFDNNCTISGSLYTQP